MVTKDRTWPSSSELERNTRQLRERLASDLRAYELRYELRSDRVEQELKAGRLRETAEVSRWIIAYEMYRSLPDEHVA